MLHQLTWSQETPLPPSQEHIRAAVLAVMTLSEEEMACFRENPDKTGKTSLRDKWTNKSRKVTG